jgi:predicted RNase H-like nuclease (RuvC/YqgF family)
MNSAFHQFRWICFLLLLFFTASCSLNQAFVKSTSESEFLQETARLENISREHPDTSVRAQAHLQLAFLYVNDKNPRLNYLRALQEMEAYLSLSPDKTQTVEFQNWLAALREMDHLREDWTEMAEKNQTLQSRIDKLQTTLVKTQEANNKMREAIERLKTLDRQMEEKRRSIK